MRGSVLQNAKPYVMTARGWAAGTNYLGMPDVYSEEFAKNVDQSASRMCTPVKDDPYLVGYFIGNEPPWPGRESDLVDMFLAGPQSATQRELKAFLAQDDTPEHRKQFVLSAFEKYLNTINAAIRKYDPNHLNLGIRFGGHISDDLVRMGRLFDVNSINIYAYEPTAEITRAHKLSGRPVLIGEFHIGSRAMVWERAWSRRAISTSAAWHTAITPNKRRHCLALLVRIGSSGSISRSQGAGTGRTTTSAS